MIILMFEPVILKNLFDESDIDRLRELAKAGTGRRVWYDSDCKRDLIQHNDLEQYFSKKLEPLARSIFNDPTLKTSFSLYAKYADPSSWLSDHVDRHACVYTLDYCLSTKTIWPLTVGGIDYPIAQNEALAFMGMDTMHGRRPISDPGNNVVEMVFFHFVPEDHWYFNHCTDFQPDVS